MSRPLSLKLENHHTRIVTGSKEIKGRVTGNDPETVMLATEGVKTVALAHIPYPKIIFRCLRINLMMFNKKSSDLVHFLVNVSYKDYWK